MARVKGAMMTRKRRKSILKAAKGYWGAKSKHFKMAKQAVLKSGNYAFAGRKAKKFLAEGNKVKAVVRFRGREMSHMELGKEVISRFEEALKGVGAAEKKPVLDGRYMSIVIAPAKPEKK